METIRYINYNKYHHSNQIDIRDIDEEVFRKYLLTMDGLYARNSLSVSPVYVVKADRIYIENFICIEDIITDGGVVSYSDILLLGKEINKLVKHWAKLDEYKGFAMLSNDLDRLLNEAVIKDIVE